MADRHCWAIVDVEVSLNDHKVHDIGALRYDGAIYHGKKRRNWWISLVTWITSADIIL